MLSLDNDGAAVGDVIICDLNSKLDAIKVVMYYARFIDFER